MEELYNFLSSLKDWGSAILGAGIFVGIFYKPVKKFVKAKFIDNDKKQDETIILLKVALLALLHDRVYDLCKTYLRRGYIKVDERKI